MSITTTPREAPTIREAVTEIVKALGDFPFTVRRVVVDDDPAVDNGPGDINAVLVELIREGLLTEVAKVDYSDQYIHGEKSVYARLFGEDTGPLHNVNEDGYLSYLYELDTCETDYLLHFDSDMRVYSNQERSPVADLLALCESFPDVAGAGLPLYAGTSGCTLDYGGKDSEVSRRGPEWDPRGFLRLHDFSTQSYMLDMRRFHKALPISLAPLNVEDCITSWQTDSGITIAAMLPHVHPPFYFRGEIGPRWTADVQGAARLAPCNALDRVI